MLKNKVIRLTELVDKCKVQTLAECNLLMDRFKLATKNIEMGDV